MLCFVFAALVVLLDQFIKRWVLLTLPLHESASLIPGIIGLTHVQNSGAAFGILSNQRWLLTAIAFFAILLLIAILLRYDEGFWGTLGLSAVLGGAIGNLVDRLAYGHVIDIFDFQFTNFAIFNIADIFITLGCFTFIVYYIMSMVKQPKPVQAVAQSAAAEYKAPEPQPPVKDEIGLYDFQYGEDKDDAASSEEDSDADAAYASRYRASQYLPRGDGASGSLSDDRDDGDFPSDIASALDVLRELEIELAELEIDKDIEDLLREYGFEDDDPEF